LFSTAFSYRNLLTWQNAIAFCAALSVTAIHYSPALASISLAMAVLLSIIESGVEKTKFRAIPKFVFILSVLLVWQILAAFLVTTDSGLNQKIFIRLPFFALPFLFVMRNWKFNLRLVWLSSISLFTLWLSAASVVNYFRHYHFLNQMVLESKPLPVFSQVYHIEFSVILAITSLSGFVFLHRHRQAFSQFAGLLLATVTLLNIFCLHLLTVRTGILCFWTGALVYSVFAIGSGKMKPFAIIFALAIVISVGSLSTSVTNRIVNSMEDLKTVADGGDLNDKSFGQRWEAWQACIYVIKQNPIAGVGLKGVEKALSEGYEANHSTLDLNKRVLPHNQFLDIAVQSGLPAVFLLFLFFVWGILFAWRKRNAFLLAILPAFAFAMLFESLLERQSGVLIFVVFFAYALANESQPSKSQIS